MQDTELPTVHQGVLARVIAFSVANPFAILVVTFLLALGGYQAFRQLPLDAIPDLSDTQVIVFTEWKGRSPDIMEDQITYPIATTLLSAPRIKTVRAQSMFGMSFVYAIFEDGTDMYWARSRVLEYLNTVTAQLPEGVAPRLGPDATGVGWGLQYALIDKSGQHNLADLRSFQDWNLRYWLRAVPGVADVASVGGFVKQYQVTVDPNLLRAYDVSLGQIRKALQESNNDVGGRSLEMTGREYMIRGRGYLKTVADIENVVVKVDRAGTPLLIKQLASVALGPELRRGLVELNGEGEAVGGIVMVRMGENMREVLSRVKAEIEKNRSAFPAGVELVVTYDRSHLIDEALDTLKHKLGEESLVVALVCVLFLLHVRSALVAVITLPLAVLIAFLPMHWLGLSANIMSLGGIAIAIGAMVDSAIVMIENAHKRLEAHPDQDRQAVILAAAQEVGPSLFFALLIITVSFLPVFILQDQEGRLFKPLAYTKTFSMFFAALLSVTLVPLLMHWLVRGKIYPEHKHPVTRILIAVYGPVVKLCLRWRWGVVAMSLLALALTWPVYQGLGSEFMPRLWEGSSMYMPTTLPGVSITEAQRLLQVQNKLLRTLPEVDTVFGKVGRAETSTDPAPLSMVETIINFKPKSQWRAGMTPQKLEAEMNALLTLPGVSNGWTMPIKGRIDMLATGIRTPLGIKLLGPDLKTLETLGKALEAQLKTLPQTRSVFADRSTGGYYLDLKIRRQDAARYGLSVKAIEDTLESAIGGSQVTTTVEGRERYSVNVRYARAFREDPESLGNVLVSTPTGDHIPLKQVVDISLTTGPPMIKSEDGQLSTTIAVDVVDMDPGRYVEAAEAHIRDTVSFPAGYTYRWSGQYEAMQRVQAQLQWVLPLTLMLIFILLYFNFRSLSEAALIMLSLPFALIGAVWFVKFMGYNLSVAVWVGMIALAGVAAETGIVMLLYLDSTYKTWLAQGRLQTRADLFACIVEGAVLRVRPKLMTVSTTIMGLVPIMWATEVGSDIMQPIAAPMIGGMISSTVLTLIVIPCVYMIWKGWRMKDVV